MMFTLITVTLNSQKTILKTINSINNQTYKEFEYIIIDGGSSDGTLDLIKTNLKKKYILLSEKDKGIYNAMNKGIKLSSGKYVGFLNSDDWLDNDTFENCKFNRKKDPSIIYGDAKFYKNNKFHFYAKANLKKLNKKCHYYIQVFMLKMTLLNKIYLMKI